MLDQEVKTNTSTPEEVEFICPKCGTIARDDVVFLCNTCSREEVVYKDGIYMCPACLNPGENFECMICESKEVRMVKKENK
ncbi:hypothetical protein HYV31_00645 [candidate division WWE3 bacterium]|nr:hypothetical protein [candidate division WWE3 bacterium]